MVRNLARRVAGILTKTLFGPTYAGVVGAPVGALFSWVVARIVDARHHAQGVDIVGTQRDALGRPSP